MNDWNDEQISRRLEEAASTVSARPDLAEVELGAGKVRTRRRLVTGVAAAMLVAAAGGAGFGLGRSVSDDDGLTVADEPAVATPAADDTDVADVPAQTPADVPAQTLAEPPPADEAAAPEPQETLPAESVVDTDAASDEAAAVRIDPGYWTSEPMTLLVERTLPSGIRVRLQSGQVWDEGWYEDGWTAADFCFQNREGRVTFDGAGVVDVAGTGLWPTLFRGVQAQVGTAGWADGHPIRFVVVQVDGAVSEIGVTWADGLADRASASDGYAVLVVEPAANDSDVWTLDYSLELVGADGTRTVTRTDMEYFDDPEYRAACSPPPPALPEPGEQPADPAAAEQALRDRFALLWDATVPRDDKRSVLDDWTGVDDAADAVFAGTYAEAAETSVHEIDEISFTSPTEAWFRYSLYTDVTNFYERYGTATLVDGEWQFARAVMCQDLSLGGGFCEPQFEQIYPPSWYERYGDPYEEFCYETEDGTVCEAPAFEEPAPASVGTIAP